MSLRIKLIWAFALVTASALVLAFAGLNLGMYASQMSMHGSPMMMGGMMGSPVLTPPQMMAGTLRWSLLSSLAAMILAGGTGYWTAGRITRPLRQLRDGVQALDLRDLSQRVEVEGSDEIAGLAGTFNRMADRLESAERARRQLLADVAHELRHPLAVLQGRLELMQDGVVALAPAALLPLQDEVIRLTRLVGDLQDLSLAEVGGLSLHRRRMQVAEVLDPLLDNLAPVAADKQINLSAEVAPALPTLDADPDRLRQVFVNLISNALHYTAPGGAVTVRAWQEDQELRVQVQDTGPGIADADLPHVFDRFYRADKSRTRATGGSGLGLAIVRSLVELHRGRVAVESQIGVGTRFTVALPIAPEPAAS